MQNIEYYKTNNLPIPVELVSTGKVNLNDKIIYKCEECGMEYVCKYSTLKFRKVKPSELICNNCINKIFDLNLKPTVPFELQKYNKDNPVPWNIFIKYSEKYNSKKWIKIRCKDCSKESIVRWDKIVNRKYAKNEPICSKCIMKHVTNLEEWKKVNSEAQLIAQNKPGAREKMRNIIINKINTDENFRRKITRYSSKLCGYYRDIKFDSSWELNVIYYYKDKIKPCSITIPYYINGKQHLYLPDFELLINNKKYILEVKGLYRESDYIKIKAAKDNIKNGLIDYDGFIMIDKDNIYKIKNMIFFDSIEKLKLIEKDLKILHYPKSWNK